MTMMSSSSSKTGLLWTLAVITSSSVVLGENKFAANSPLGRKLIENAQVIQKSSHALLRGLENNNNGQDDNYDNNQDGIYDLGSLYIQYLGCSSFEDQYNQYGGNNGDNQNYGYSTISNLVRFTLCTSCSGGCSGEYAIGMLEFLESYAERQQQEEEQQCEYIKEHCYCSSGYSSSCLYNCYSSAGMEQCSQMDNGDEEGGFRLEEFLECRQAYGNNNNNNNNNGQVQFYVGPYCGSDSQIYLGAYYDQYCTTVADTSYFMSLNYGDGFPYFYEPLLASNQCLTCLEENGSQDNGDDYNNNDDANDQYYQAYAEANELCLMSTEDANYKCDSDRGYESGCTFLGTTLPCMDGRGCAETGEDSESWWHSSGGGSSSSSKNGTSVGNNMDKIKEMEERMFEKLMDNKAVFGSIVAGILLVLLSTCACCIYSCCRSKNEGDSDGLMREKLFQRRRVRDPVEMDRMFHR